MAIGLSLLTCESNPSASEATSEPSFDASAIQGTWEMTHYMPEDTNTVIPVEDFSQFKFYTKDRFFFVGYNKDSIELYGGGTYTITQDSFTETLEFMSWDPGNGPNQFTFSHKLDGDRLSQSGLMESSSEDGEDFKLEERYKKVEGSIAATSDHPYAGLWKMVENQNGDLEELTTVPDSIISMKLVTNDHFLIAFWNNNHLKPNGILFGKQQMKEGQYIETIVANTMNQEMNGRSFPYSVEGADNAFRMYGEIPADGENTEPYKIDERYTRVE